MNADEHDHGPTARLVDEVYCLTCQHTHIGTIPVTTFRCAGDNRSCGFGCWGASVAAAHAESLPDHIVYPCHHATVPAPEADAPVPQRDALWGKACPFCPIIEGDSAATIVERGERHVAFVPLGPHVPGHVLFVPIEHLPDATVNPARTGEVVAQASRYVAEQGIDANIITSVGTAAMQSVPHLHVHVVPRGPDDGLPTRWPWLPVPQRDAGVREAVLAWADEAPEHTPGLDLLRQIVTPVDSAPATREAEDRGESS